MNRSRTRKPTSMNKVSNSTSTSTKLQRATEMGVCGGVAVGGENGKTGSWGRKQKCNKIKLREGLEKSKGLQM